VSFGDIYDYHCEDAGFAKEEPILYAGEKVKQVLRGFNNVPARQVCFLASTVPLPCSLSLQLTKTEYITLKKDIFDEVGVKLVPDSVISNVSAAQYASVINLHLK
jgi:transformation/transcription domain-associated protein